MFKKPEHTNDHSEQFSMYVRY